MEPIDGYQPLEELGRGGMGVVYRARAPWGEEVALKMLLPEVAQDPELLLRFKREAKLGRGLRHPGIARVRDAGTWKGRPYLVMDLLEGRSLSQLLRQDGPPPPDQARELALVLAESLDHAHQHGVIHRDLKPDNVMLTKHGPVVTDLGLAKLRGGAIQSLTVSGVVLGTPAYMAPEQALGEHVDGRADVYGLGATLYALLTGSPPFRRETALGVLEAVVEDPVQPPSELRPDIPAALEAVCLRCLAKDPGLRFPSMAALAHALRAGGAAPAPRSGATVAVLGALLAAAVLIGLLAALASSQPTPTASVAPATPTGPTASELVQRGGTLLDEGGDMSRVRDLIEEALKLAPEALGPELLRARWLTQTDRLEEAEVLFASLITEHPNDPDVLLRRGELRYLFGRPADALGDLRRALTLRPRHRGTLHSLAMTLFDTGGREEARRLLEAAIARGDPDAGTVAYLGQYLTVIGVQPRGDELFEQALAIGSDQAEIYLMRARARLNARRYEDALVDVRRSMALDPNSRHGAPLAAEILTELGQDLEAVEMLDRALLRDPGQHELWYQRGLAFFRQDRFHEAQASLDRALGVEPRSVLALAARSGVYTKMRQYDLALADADRALELAPGQTDLLRRRGELYVRLGRHQDAEPDLQRVVAAEPRDAANWQALAFLRTRSGELELAAEALHRAIELAPQKPSCYAELYEVMKLAQDLPGAREALQGLVAAVPPNPELSYELVRLQITLNELDGALGSIERCLELAPDFAQAWGTHAYLLTLAGELGQARQSLGRTEALGGDAGEVRVLRSLWLTREGRHAEAAELVRPMLGPDAPLAWYIRAEAYRGLGQLEQARADYEQFVSIRPPHHLVDEARRTLTELGD